MAAGALSTSRPSAPETRSHPFERPGNDTLLGAVGSDTCDGGTGTDTQQACEVKTNIP